MILRHKFIGRDWLEKNEVIKAFNETKIYARSYAASNLQELRKNYGIKYFTIVQDEGVIDSDENRFSLIKRLQKNNDQKSVIIDTIGNLIKLDVSRN